MYPYTIEPSFDSEPECNGCRLPRTCISVSLSELEPTPSHIRILTVCLTPGTPSRIRILTVCLTPGTPSHIRILTVCLTPGTPSHIRILTVCLTLGTPSHIPILTVCLTPGSGLQLRHCALQKCD